MQLPATLVADHDGNEEYFSSTNEEIEVDIEVFKKFSSGHTHCVDDTIGSLSSTTDDIHSQQAEHQQLILTAEPRELMKDLYLL